MKCGGMIATVWHLAYYSYLSPEFDATVKQSAVYFDNPAFNQPKKESLKYELMDERGNLLGNETVTGYIPVSVNKVRFRTDEPKNFKYDKHKLFMVPYEKPGYNIEIALEKNKNGDLVGVFELSHDKMVFKRAMQFMLKVIHSDSKNSYTSISTSLHGFVYGGKKPSKFETKNSGLLSIDFAGVTPQQKAALWFNGTCATPIHIDNGTGKAAITAEGLNVGAIASAWAAPSNALNEQFSRAFKLNLEVKMTDQITGGNYAALFTKGSYNSGFRLLVKKSGQLLFQMSRMFGKNPLNLLTNYKIPLNKWVKISVTYRAPENGVPGEATLTVDDRKTITAKVPRNIDNNEVTRVIGIGCQFREMPLVMRKKKKYYPNFPGFIRNIFISK